MHSRVTLPGYPTASPTVLYCLFSHRFSHCFLLTVFFYCFLKYNFLLFLLLYTASCTDLYFSATVSSFVRQISTVLLMFFVQCLLFKMFIFSTVCSIVLGVFAAVLYTVVMLF